MSDINRHNAHQLRADRRETLHKWLRNHGVNPNDCAPTIAIVFGTREWELHISEYQRDADGAIVIDLASTEAATAPRIIPLSQTFDGPAWLIST